MPELNLTGLKIGFWDVLEKDNEKSKEKHQSYWKCRCNLCGNIYSVRGSSLNNGKSQKCGICSRSYNVKDETGQKYNKLTVLYKAGSKNNRVMWKCQCDCGNHIDVSGTDLRTGAVKSCGKCPGRESLGEKLIREKLTQFGIDFIQEYTFKDLVFETGHYARFDFYIPSHNYIIEFDGIQHFSYGNNSSWNTEEKFLETKKRDNIKNNYCFNHNIPIIRIPYDYKEELTAFDLIPQTSKFLIRKG